MPNDPLGVTARLITDSGTASYVSLAKLAAKTGADVARLPHTVKILLENIARRAGGRDVSEADVVALARWPNGAGASIAFMPARVLMQDFTGVPAVVDLAALRSAVVRSGGDPKRVNPFIPVDLVIDHSVQVDRFGSTDAYAANLQWEYRRNRERYALLNWAQQAFEGFRVVPPGMGICHQVNLEHLGRVVSSRGGWVFPDTLVGTDSHTPMINGLGVLGWGVGGIEAEAAMLGQPMFLPEADRTWSQDPRNAPDRYDGHRSRPDPDPNAESTRRRRQVRRILRTRLERSQHRRPRHAVEHVAGVRRHINTLPGRLEHSEISESDGPAARSSSLVERYTREQGLFRTDEDPEPLFNEVLDLDLGKVEPSVAGPKRPQDRVPLPGVRKSFKAAFDGVEAPVDGKDIARLVGEGGSPAGEVLEAPPEPIGTAARSSIRDRWIRRHRCNHELHQYV